MHQTMQAFLETLRTSTAMGYRRDLNIFNRFLDEQQIDALAVTTAQLSAYQRWLAEEYRSPRGRRLGNATRGTKLAAVMSYYGWLVRRGEILLDPSAHLRLPRVRRKPLSRDYLAQQEAMALVQTQSEYLNEQERGTYRWASAHRNLTWLCVALATGRRKSSLRDLKVSDFNVPRNEVRVEWEKGKPGRVLPITEWAMAVVDEHVRIARPLILDGRQDKGWLFVGQRRHQVGSEVFRFFLNDLVGRTVEANPDLEELEDKTITPHGLRVSFATMLFSNGCGVRTVNELLLHERLSTTLRYTPVPMDDLRRACRQAHPRA